MDNDDLLKSLQSEARRRKILPTAKAFNCEHYQDCQQSRRDLEIPLLHGWKTSLMSYVGREYGKQVAGKTLRIVIVGMSHAGSGGSDFFERQRFGKKAVRHRANPHYRGVLRMAAAILGGHGRYCFEKCRSRCTYEDLPCGKRCALMSVAQPNLAKCAGGNETKCLSTLRMYSNCSDHLLAELEVLRPTVIVFQAKAARSVFPTAVERSPGWSLRPLARRPCYDDDFAVAQRLEADNFSSYVLFLNHPARANIERQWKPQIQPALKLLKSCGAIPR